MFHNAAIGLHDQERNVAGGRFDLVGSALQICAAIRLHQNVNQSRHRALVFAVFGQHDRRKRHEDIGKVLGDDLAHPPLMEVVSVGMQQTHGDAAHTVFHHFLYRCNHGRLTERLDLAAVEAHAAWNFLHQMQRHETSRLYPEKRIAVAVRHRLAGDFDQMTETLGDQQPQAIEFVFEHGIGCDRRAVQQHVHIGGGAPRRLKNLADTFNQTETLDRPAWKGF